MSQTPIRAALDDLDHLRQMRDTHPVWRDPDTGAWTIYRYEDVAAALADPRTFSSNFGVLLAEHEDELLGGNILAMDPPRHDQLRSLVSQAFTPRAIGQLEGRIGELTEELLNQTRGAAQVELVADLAYPLPVTVIAEFLGVPAADRTRFRKWADAGARTGHAAILGMRRQ